MIVETVAIDTLVLDPTNARKHDAKNLEAIKGSLLKFGQQKPIVVNKDGVVVAGNGTLEAMRSLGKQTIAVVRTDLKGNDAVAYALADNRTTDLSIWDDEILGKTLQGLYEDNYAIADIGFDPDEYIKPSEGLTPDDDVPELKIETEIKRGHIYQLGNHRLMCGDSTSNDDVGRLMNGEKADMVFTDPPYGIEIVKAGFVSPRNAPSPLAKARQYRNIDGDDAPFNPSLILGLNSKTTILWGADHYASKLPDNPQWLIWDKKLESGKLDHNNFSDCELAWTNSKALSAKIYRHTWAGMLRVGDRKDELKDRVHPTQKPVGLCADIIQDFSKDGESILDLYLGSGSTLIACEKTNRKCYGMEIDPQYCQVIIDRWEQYTGKKATLHIG